MYTEIPAAGRCSTSATVVDILFFSYFQLLLEKKKGKNKKATNTVSCVE